MEEEKGEEGGEEERENGRRRRRRKIVVERVEKTRMTKDKVDQWSNQRSREFFRTSLLCLYTLFIPIWNSTEEYKLNIISFLGTK